jgi:hypothetical protein
LQAQRLGEAMGLWMNDHGVTGAKAKVSQSRQE